MFTLEDMLAQVGRYKAAILETFPRQRVQSVLVIPGVLTPDRMKAVAAAGVELWDQRWIISHARQLGLDEEVDHLFGDVSHGEPLGLPMAELLQARLGGIACGRIGWDDYQKACGEILEYLFYPPLKTPIPESSNVPRINRRDFVVPNYAPDGFWHFMRLHYRADYIVVDAKNHCGEPNKSHVLQLENMALIRFPAVILCIHYDVIGTIVQAHEMPESVRGVVRNYKIPAINSGNIRALRNWSFKRRVEKILEDPPARLLVVIPADTAASDAP